MFPCQPDRNFSHFFFFFLFIQNNKLQTQIQLQTWTDKRKNIEQDRTHWDAKNVCHTQWV